MRLVLWMAVPLLGLCIHVLRAEATREYFDKQRYEDVYYVPPNDWLPVFCLGYREACADALWMKGLVYFGEEIRHRGEVRHLFDYGEAIVTLDPDFKQIYRWVGSAAIYRTGHVTEKDIRRAVAFLERGVKRFPEDGNLAWDLGATLTYELPPLLKDRSEKEEARARGVQHLQVAARLGAGPSWLALTNATELRRLGRTEQAIRHLEEMFDAARDPGVRKEIQTQLAELRSRSYAEAFHRAYGEIEKRRRAWYPYLDVGLFLLVEPREVTQ